MNWDAIGSMSELVGALAVVITLVYLGTQIRASTKASKAVVREGVANSLQNTMLARLDSEVLARAGVKQTSGEALDGLEKNQLFWWHCMWWRTYENIYYQYKNGYLEEVEWQGYEQVISRSFDPSNPTAQMSQLAWSHFNQVGGLSTDFIDHVENLRQAEK